MSKIFLLILYFKWDFSSLDEFKVIPGIILQSLVQLRKVVCYNVINSG